MASSFSPLRQVMPSLRGNRGREGLEGDMTHDGADPAAGETAGFGVTDTAGLDGNPALVGSPAFSAD